MQDWELKVPHCDYSKRDWKYGARCVISSYEALNTVRLIKRADLFTSFIKYSLLLKVFQNAYHTRIAFLWGIIRFLCRTMTNATPYITRCDSSLNPPLTVSRKKKENDKQKKRRWDDSEAIPHLVFKCTRAVSTEFLVLIRSSWLLSAIPEGCIQTICENSMRTYVILHSQYGCAESCCVCVRWQLESRSLGKDKNIALQLGRSLSRWSTKVCNSQEWHGCFNV